MLTTGDHARIAEAIRAAEAKTAGEIYCIVTDEVSKYREVPIAFGAAAALILPPAALLLGLRPWSGGPVGSAWTDAPDLGVAVSTSLALYAVVQTLIFAAAAFIAAAPAVRRRITPDVLKSHRVKRTAYAHFASTGLMNTSERTGVLIFASLKDRKVELVADAAIHREVGDEAWDQAVAALAAGMRSRDPAAGFLRAIGICGDALAAHFPPAGEHRPHGDGVIELA